MTVHCFRAYAAPDVTVETMTQRINDHLFSVYGHELSEQSAINKVGGEIHGQEILVGIARFPIDEDKQAIIDDMKNKIVHDLSWYKIDYHECNHDDPSEPEGEWEELSRHGTVPGGVA